MEKEEQVLLTEEEDWRKPYYLIFEKTLPEDTVQAEKLKRQNLKFYLLNEILYRKGFNEKMLSCLRDPRYSSGNSRRRLW